MAEQEASIDIIPISLNALPAPIRVVSEAQKKYATLVSMLEKVVGPLLNKALGEIAVTGEIPPDFYKIMKEIKDMSKLSLDYLKFIKEITLDTQMSFEQLTTDLLMKIAQDNPDFKKALGDQAVTKAREYLVNREVVEIDTG